MTPYVAELLKGDRRALARALTQIENETPLGGEILAALYPHTGYAWRVGFTGSPGTGKSSLVSALANYIRHQGKTVAIVAVDPSSPFSRGAVLGDRIRMQALSGDEGVFIRSMASRGSLGGLARTTLDVARALDAAGFDFVFIETVGAGQSEVAIAGAAQTTLVVEAPGLGDDIQATKAGILEIADILVVNKSDHPSSAKTVNALKAMLNLGHRTQMVAHHGQRLLQQDIRSTPTLDTWSVPVLKTSTTLGEGIEEVCAAILDHREHLESTKLVEERDRARLEAELALRLQNALLKDFLAKTPPERLQELLERMALRELAPSEAVRELLFKGQLGR